MAQVEITSHVPAVFLVAIGKTEFRLMVSRRRHAGHLSLDAESSRNLE